MSPRPRKQFGQHWLRSDAVLRRIVAAAEINTGDRLLEIGPGTGLLTRQLLAQKAWVVAVEIDRDLCETLRKTFRTIDSFLLVEGDILAIDLEAYLAEFLSWQNPRKVVANIPYYITGPILERLLGTLTQPNPNPYERLVLLVQKEVADRLCAKPSSKAFGALSVRVQYLAHCEVICPVPAKAFYPPPKVDSAVVRLTPRSLPQPASNLKRLDQLVRLGFSSRRKMLRNNLKSVIESDRLSALLSELELNPQARAEDLGVAEWVALSERLPEDKTKEAVEMEKME